MITIQLVVAFNFDLSETNTDTKLTTKRDKVTNVSDVEIGYLDGVTSLLQTQLDDKAAAFNWVQGSFNITTGSDNNPANTITSQGLNIYVTSHSVTFPANTFTSGNIYVYLSHHSGFSGAATVLRMWVKSGITSRAFTILATDLGDKTFIKINYLAIEY